MAGEGLIYSSDRLPRPSPYTELSLGQLTRLKIPC